ncbi:uncharacterized protein A4U43_C09F15600 [Asparagus officinalis]|uniref:Uncharacterized protein n=1 Tax=Asparagus officinalis TaxID=4686 RepID=A0A5P1E7Z1_ASPOF|nr:uncharacterized protein A4U43_C09F15600 [Asparagus officinalis]
MANMDHSWVVDVKSELNDVDASSELDDIWTKHSIYMVPALIKDLNPKAYKPQIISFGPYHYGDEKLRPMEIHKRRALIHFLKRAQKPLQDFMSALEEVAGVLMDSYESLDGSRHGMSNVMLHIKMDMLRIENQLPLLVLKKLAAAETGAAPDDDEDDDEINRLVLDFMGSRPVPSQVGLGLHTLDLFRRSCVRFPAGEAVSNAR